MRFSNIKSGNIYRSNIPYWKATFKVIKKHYHKNGKYDGWYISYLDRATNADGWTETIDLIKNCTLLKEDEITKN